MAASRSTRVTRSSVGINGLDENFCGRTLRNRSIAHPEDTSPIPPQRARSPKKKQDCLQPLPKVTNSGKVSDLKQQQNVRESWMSPRKRGLSCSEKDFPDKQATENCERRHSEGVSPVFKRVKRCSRSGDLTSSEEDSPVKLEKSTCSKGSAAENDEDCPGSKRARRCLVLDDCDKGEIKKVDSPVDRFDCPVFSGEAHQVTNGLDEQDLDDVNCSDKTVDSCVSADPTGTGSLSAGNKTLALLNGSKVNSALDPDVPCRNLRSEQAELDSHRAAGSSSPSVVISGCLQQPSAVSSSENLSSFREPEEEVDVVGDSGSSSRECVVENTNGGLSAVQDNKPISGEPEPPLGLDCDLDEVESFMEPQEHRYTLRTSPRRAACSKGSPHKLNSPSRDNGSVREEKESPHGSNVQAETKADEEPCGKAHKSHHEGQSTSSDTARECFGEGMDKLAAESGLPNSRLLTPAKELVSSSSHATEEDEDEEDPDVYFFESDHLALKHNKDYQRLLQTIAVLEAQRTQAIQDLENLAMHQKESLNDPIVFVEQLQKRVDIGLPCPQRVVQLPEIAWDQYTSGLGDFEREFRNKKRHTRRLQLIFDKVGLPVRPRSPLDSKKDGGESSSYSALPSSDAPEHTASSSRSQVIRGRICDQSKPETFNQLWTVEEQKKLEQLLLKFPPEEVESKRWQKIADELGNRTAKQVASRVQKYFIKLTKAGIPVPGRTPNLYMYNKKASSKRQHHLNKHLYRPSTFMTSYEPPVYMDDDDDRSSYCSNLQDLATEDSDEESIPIEYRHLPEYKELLQLKKMKKLKLQQIHAESALVQHLGFKCDNCGVEPIQGVRWHCQDCPQDNSVDFCDGCSDCLHKTETHKPDHQLDPIYRADTYLDRDYCMPQNTGYSYLDPNYFPANR
ncbi:ZZ-type zinc finger-containing protein 3-like [Acipenser oxyrinchus oxyrinchus]|uniref:ZZ-type zinc finger-containing protein 3 n=1 Tax=Acipenser oxyrinchus oxyrinchus TaxID=40147 RepID=A0AAD8D9W3_ACIOX|nr:ZZ-type zinc finger-containing protein 3-like [Acipenser oxyrinchus oxyrinchus]